MGSQRVRYGWVTELNILSNVSLQINLSMFLGFFSPHEDDSWKWRWLDSSWLKESSFVLQLLTRWSQGHREVALAQEDRVGQAILWEPGCPGLILTTAPQPSLKCLFLCKARSRAVTDPSSYDRGFNRVEWASSSPVSSPSGHLYPHDSWCLKVHIVLGCTHSHLVFMWQDCPILLPSTYFCFSVTLATNIRLDFPSVSNLTVSVEYMYVYCFH